MNEVKYFFISLCLLGVTSLRAEEQQSQGYRFEHEVIKQLTGLEKLEVPYTSDWDIPAEYNKKTGRPISVKFIRWGNSVYLGDALRQRKNKRVFEIVIGFYEPDLKSEYGIVQAVHHLVIEPQQWDKWWGEITEEEIQRLSDGIKNKPLAQAQAFGRVEAKRLRAKVGLIDVNPKVNKDQRRIQCSIPFELFYQEVIKQESTPQIKLELNHKPFPSKILLGARSRN